MPTCVGTFAPQQQTVTSVCGCGACEYFPVWFVVFSGVSEAHCGSELHSLSPRAVETTVRLFMLKRGGRETVHFLLFPEKLIFAPCFCARLVISASHHPYSFSGTLSETFAFQCRHPAVDELDHRHPLLQQGNLSPRADFGFFRRPRQDQSRVYHRFKEDPGPSKFLHQDHPRQNHDHHDLGLWHWYDKERAREESWDDSQIWY